MITTIHHNLVASVSKQILKSMVGSINASVIAYARGHLRFDALENISVHKNGRTLADVPHIDDYCDAHAALDEAIENGNASEAMGFAKQMANAEIIERLMTVRNYLADELTQLATQQNDVPLTIAETIRFQLDRQPDNNESLVEALALAVDIDPEMLKAAKIKMLNDDRADLIATAGRVVTYLQTFDGPSSSAAYVDDQFEGLPAHVQYKLVGAVIRSYDKASQKAMLSLLRGKLDAAGDIKMIKGAVADAHLWMKSFAQQNRAELDAYIERGGSLPEIEDRTVVGVKVEVKPAPTPAVEAPPAEVKAKPAMRRVPKQAA